MSDVVAFSPSRPRIDFGPLPPLPPGRRSPHGTAVTGRVAELRFVAEALVRGYEDVWSPEIDTGVDFMVDCVPVQVKGARATSNGQYVFSAPKRSLAARVVAFHGVDENVWWICSWHDVLGWGESSPTIGLSTTPPLHRRGRPRSRWAHVFGRRDAWEVIREQGLSLKDFRR